MKKWISLLAIVALVLVLAACGGAKQNNSSAGSNAGGGTPAAPADKQEKTNPVYLTVGAPPSSSALYGYWVATAKAIESVYPELKFTITETQGAVDITKRVRTGLVPLGNSVSNTDYDNYNGTGTFQGDAFKDLRMIWYFDTTPMQWIVSKDAGIKTLYDLNGKKFNPGATNSSAAAITKLVMKELGIAPNFFDAGQKDAADAVVNRQIIGTSKAGPAPDSFVQQIQGSLAVDLVGLSDEDIKKLSDKYGYLVPYTIKAGTYKGIDHDVKTLTVLMGAQTTSKLPQETGYKMFKAIWEGGKDSWSKAYPVGAKNNIPELTLQSKIPLHAGAVQYLKEKGINVPKELIPSEYKEK